MWYQSEDAAIQLEIVTIEQPEETPTSPIATAKRTAEGSPEKDQDEDEELYTEADSPRIESRSLTSDSATSSRKKARSHRATLSAAEYAILKAAQKKQKVMAIFKDKEAGLNNDIINVFCRMEEYHVLQLSTLIPDILPSAAEFDLNILSQVPYRS